MLTVGRGNCILFFSAENKPVYEVDEGCTIQFKTVDCYSNKWQEGIDLTTHKMGSGNPGIGPVFVKETYPGDVLKVTIEKIELDDEGVMLSVPGFGALGEKLSVPEAKNIPIRDGKAIFNEKIHIPVKPMIGLIGVAPEGEGIRSTLPGPHGGNMDNNMISEGAVVYFPVFVKGALFALGDLHAVMGDGEIGFNGVEISGTVTVKLEVIKGLKIKEPVVESRECFSTVASAKTIDEAVDYSIKYMIDLITERTDISDHELNMLLSLVGEVQICQVVSALKTVRFVMPKYVLDKYGFVI